MKKTSLGPDFLVGLFVLCGLAAVAGLVILLSGVSTADLGVTRITVKMKSADGLIKGTKVMMSGVRIGRVTDSPDLTPDGRQAIVHVAIQQPFKVREGADFVVKPEGILGDRFVEVIPPKNLDAPALKNGDVAEGSRMTGLGDLADTAQDLVSEIKPTLATVQDASKRLDSILTKVDTQVLNEETTESLRNTITELGQGVDKLNVAMSSADTAMANAKDASGSLKSAMAKVDEQMLDAETVAQFKKAINDLEKTVSNLQQFTSDLQKGQGVIGRLSTDKKLADDLAAFVHNLRERGILFYADVTTREEKKEKREKEEAREQARTGRSSSSRPSLMTRN